MSRLVSMFFKVINIHQWKFQIQKTFNVNAIDKKSVKWSIEIDTWINVKFPKIKEYYKANITWV